ncbi:hypothetical protein [Conyzicola sp.]|uniref:hypothetical protein n=1 Tax=Conyzicola sp. TaxID=1969404 RepID=UPI0039891038
MDLSQHLRAVRLLALAGLATLLWFIVSLFIGSSSASADDGSLVDPVGTLVGSVTEPLAPVVAAPVQAVEPVVQAVAPIAAQAVTVAVPAPVVAAVAPVVAPVVTVASPVTAPVVAVIAPVVAPLSPVVDPLVPVVSAVVSPLSPALAEVVAPLAPAFPTLTPAAPVVDGLLVDGIPVDPSQPAADDVSAGVMAASVTGSVSETDATARATTARANPHTSLSMQLATSARLDTALGMPSEVPLPAAPTALSGSAASSAAGLSFSSADLVRGFDVTAAGGAAVSTLADDELPSSPTFPSDTTPD